MNTAELCFAKLPYKKVLAVHVFASRPCATKYTAEGYLPHYTASFCELCSQALFSADAFIVTL